MTAKKRRAGSFGGRACRALRSRILEIGMDAMPKSWRRKWMMQRILATPPWADMKRIAAVYDEAAAKGWTVGHIVPLNHPRVCGLHVHWNLKPEPAALNFSKGNAWCEWHGELFPETFDPHQLNLL